MALVLEARQYVILDLVCFVFPYFSKPNLDLTRAVSKFRVLEEFFLSTFLQTRLQPRWPAWPSQLDVLFELYKVTKFRKNVQTRCCLMCSLWQLKHVCGGCFGVLFIVRCFEL